MSLIFISEIMAFNFSGFNVEQINQNFASMH